jgi:hypothetical protein
VREAFERHLHRHIAAEVRQWKVALDRAHAIAFSIFDEWRRNGRLLTLTLRYAASPETDPDRWDVEKWTFMSERSIPELRLGGLFDPEGMTIRDELLDGAKGAAVVARFAQAATVVAKRLHEDGVVTKRFKRPLPILIHTPDQPTVSLAETRRANPPKLADGYLRFVRRALRQAVDA